MTVETPIFGQGPKMVVPWLETPMDHQKPIIPSGGGLLVAGESLVLFTTENLIPIKYATQIDHVLPSLKSSIRSNTYERMSD